MLTIYNMAKPFIKWVGGKGQLLSQLKVNLPVELYNEAFTYIEPFVGGGAMLFFMLQKFPKIKRVVINDINKNLTDAYKTVKENPDELVYRLKHLEQQFLSISDYEDQRAFYLKIISPIKRKNPVANRESSMETICYSVFE